MKSDKPKTKRITLTISTELFETLTELKKCSGNTLNFFPALTLENNIDVFRTLVTCHETAKTDKQKAIDDMNLVLSSKMLDAAKNMAES